MDSDGKRLGAVSSAGWRGFVSCFTVTGVKASEIQKDPNALAQAIVELGEQGWEMVGWLSDSPALLGAVLALDATVGQIGGREAVDSCEVRGRQTHRLRRD